MKRTAPKKSAVAPKRGSADAPEGKGGVQYHVGVAKGQVAETIVLVGDRGRAKLVAAEFDGPPIYGPIKNREYVTYTGVRKGRPLTVCATGMGCDNTEIAVVELLNCVGRADFLRIGSCGALQPETAVGDLIVSTGALRFEATSKGFVRDEYPALAHHETTLALISSATRQEAPFRVGLTATTAGFYGWQAREGGPFLPREPELDAELGRLGVENFEMEASTLFVLASLRGLRAGCVCVVFANRPRGEFIAPGEKLAAERRAIAVGLGALDILAVMDGHRGGDRWFSL